MSVADVNGDGNADVIVANTGDQNVSVLLGDEQGNFAPQMTFTVGSSPHSVNVTDVNNDGKLDLVTASADGNNVSILLNTTEGTEPTVVVKPVVITPPIAVQHLPTGKIQISGNAIQDETLSIQNTLKDEDGLGAFKYQWLRNSKAISGATKTTYTLSADDIGTAISVKVSYTDGLKKLESVTSSATTLIEPKPEEIQPSTYTLTVDKTSVNEGDTVTFKLTTKNVEADTEIPFSFSGSISNADVLGAFKTTSFVVDSNGKASLAVKFLADKFTDGAENLTATLNDDAAQTVSVLVKDTSVAPIVKPATSKSTLENTSTNTVKIDGLTLTAKSNAKDLLIGTEKNDFLTGLAGADTL